MDGLPWGALIIAPVTLSSLVDAPARHGGRRWLAATLLLVPAAPAAPLCVITAAGLPWCRALLPSSA